VKANLKDIGYAIAKGSTGSIPLVGGIFSELFNVAFTDPATKRREQVLLDMNVRLQSLEVEGYDVGQLAKSDEFLTIAMQAYNIALKSHQEEKRIALMNTITNTPKLQIDENKKLMYLNYLDEFNEWHLKILSFLDNPVIYFEDSKKPNISIGGKSSILIEAFPELSSQRSFYDRIVIDLFNKGLIVYQSLHVIMSEQGIWQSGTSEFGKDFLQFISD